MDAPLVIPKKGEERLLLLFAAILIVGGIAFSAGLFVPRLSSGTDVRVAGYILIALGAICLPWAASVARRTPKALILSPTGFFDPQLMRSEVPWEAISGVDVTHFGKRLLNVRMDRYTKRYAGVGFLASLLHGITGGSGIAYQARNFVDPLDQVADKVIAAYKAAQTRVSEA